jgi:hypothetical protein
VHSESPPIQPCTHVETTPKPPQNPLTTPPHTLPGEDFFTREKRERESCFAFQKKVEYHHQTLPESSLISMARERESWFACERPVDYHTTQESFDKRAGLPPQPPPPPPLRLRELRAVPPLPLFGILNTLKQAIFVLQERCVCVSGVTAVSSSTALDRVTPPPPPRVSASAAENVQCVLHSLMVLETELHLLKPPVGFHPPECRKPPPKHPNHPSAQTRFSVAHKGNWYSGRKKACGTQKQKKIPSSKQNQNRNRELGFFFVFVYHMLFFRRCANSPCAPPKTYALLRGDLGVLEVVSCTLPASTLHQCERYVTRIFAESQSISENKHSPETHRAPRPPLPVPAASHSLFVQSILFLLFLFFLPVGVWVCGVAESC